MEIIERSQKFIEAYRVTNGSAEEQKKRFLERLDNSEKTGILVKRFP